MLRNLVAGRLKPLRLGAGAVAIAAAVGPLALVSPASADQPIPYPTTTKISIGSSSQQNVQPNTNLAGTALTALQTGTVLTVAVSGPAGSFFGADARVCKPGLDIQLSSQFNPSGGNCTGTNQSIGNNGLVVAAGVATVTFPFTVPSGSLVANASTFTCNAANPCALWLREAVDTAMTPDGTGNVWVHYEIKYAGSPDAPTVTTVAANQACTVNWTPPVNTGNAPIDLYAATLTDGAAYTQTVNVTPPAANTASFTVPALVNFTTYTASVTARNVAVDGTTHFTSVAGTATCIPAPAGPVITNAAPGDTKITLSISAPSGPAPNEYRITVSPAPVSGANPRLTGTPVSSYDFTNLANGTLYTFTVEARYGASFSAPSAPVQATPTGVQITQTITVRRAQGALVFTQVCTTPPVGSATAPKLSATNPYSLGAGALDPAFGAGQYPYPTDANGDPLVYATDCAIDLGTPRLLTGTGPGAGQFFQATGAINQVTVVDTRDNDPGWNVNGQMGTFTLRTDPLKTFSGKWLGWSPVRVSDTGPFTDDIGLYDQTTTAGPSVAASLGQAGQNGLGGSGSTLGRTGSPAQTGAGTAGVGLGIAVFDANITLNIPITAKTGTYDGVLTITSI